MKQKKLGDPEFHLLLEEEKRLCEKNIELIKGILKKGIGEKNGKLVDKDIYNPSIKLSRKLDHKDLYKFTDSHSQWKLMTDVKKKLIVFLDIKFPKTDAPELHFCFEMDLNLHKAGEGKIIKIDNREYKATPYQFEDNTDTILQWMVLLIETECINIVDGEDPSVEIDGIPTDIPKAILDYVRCDIGEGEKDHRILVTNKNSLRKDFI